MSSRRDYQLEYSRENAEMHSFQGRERKAETMLRVLREALGDRLAKVDVLNLGCSTGIIDEYLAPHVHSMTGVDIDEPAVQLAQSRVSPANVTFHVDDAMALRFEDGRFDVVICSQVYEHVPDAVRMMAEIQRVLRPGGVCYFAATNRWGVMEKHYHLPFLSWLPSKAADAYLRLSGKGDAYYEKHMGYRELLNLASAFDVEQWTDRIITDPERYAAGYMFPSRLGRVIARSLHANLRQLFPGFIWLLWKREA